MPELQLAGVAAETGQQRVVGDVGGRRRSWRLGTSCACGAMRSHSAGEGCGSHRCTSRCSASASTTSRCAVVSRVGPNSDSRCGRSTRLGSARRRWQAGERRSAGLATPIRRRTRRHSSACQRRSSRDVGVVVVDPGPEHRRTVRAVRVVQGGEVTGGGQPPPGAVSERCVADAEMAGPASRTTPPGRIRRWSRAAARPAGPASTGRRRA